MGDLHPPAARQVAIVVKLLLQLQDLLASVGGPRALGLPAGVIGVYWTHTEREGERESFIAPEREEGNPFFLPANTEPPAPTTSSWREGVEKGRPVKEKKKKTQTFGGLYCCPCCLGEGHCEESWKDFHLTLWLEDPNGVG